MIKRVWITWETQRRSLELSKKLGCELYIFEETGKLRYPKSILKTINVLIKTNPDILFVQNPSMILATLACLYGIISKTIVIVDRHTTFLLSRTYPISLWLIFFKLLHRFTIKFADLTIVTNDFLAGIVWQLGGRPFVLPDKLPELTYTGKVPLRGKINIFMISSFGKDEPIESVINAMRAFEPGDTVLYISGNNKKLDKRIVDNAPQNIVFTGFIPDDEFSNMIYSSDVIMVLTTSDYCMLCGCYESVSADKPLITSNKKVLKDYFAGAIFVDNSTESIIQGINSAINNLEQHRNDIQRLKQLLIHQWEERYNKLEVYIKEVQGEHE